MSGELGVKTQALLDENHARRRVLLGRVLVIPKLDQRYVVSELPPGSVVRVFGDAEYVVGQSGRLMRWEQPIPMSENWRCTYVGRLHGHGRDVRGDEGRWMTPRERAQVDEATS